MCWRRFPRDRCRNVLAFDFRAGGGLPVSQLVFYHVLPLSLYWVARQARYSSRIVLGMLAGWALFGVYLSLTAIRAEAGGLDWLIYPKYIASPGIPSFSGDPRTALEAPSGSGILQGLCLAAAAVLLAGRARRASWRGRHLPRDACRNLQHADTLDQGGASALARRLRAWRFRGDCACRRCSAACSMAVFAGASPNGNG